MTNTAENIGPSGWPEDTAAQRIHAVNMLRKSLLGTRRNLASRTRADIANRPQTREQIAALEAHIERLRGSI